MKIKAPRRFSDNTRLYQHARCRSWLSPQPPAKNIFRQSSIFWGFIFFLSIIVIACSETIQKTVIVKPSKYDSTFLFLEKESTITLDISVTKGPAVDVFFMDAANYEAYEASEEWTHYLNLSSKSTKSAKLSSECYFGKWYFVVKSISNSLDSEVSIKVTITPKFKLQ